jgi:peptidoglycan/LPS O-acetylase OafA/YrhL
MSVTSTERIHFLDGVRGWGAIFVVLYHLWVEGFPVSKTDALFLKKLFIFNGHLAVYIFFIASGFSLTISYFRNNDTVVLKKILVGRYFRLIIPIGVASIICYMALLGGLIPPTALRPDAFSHFISETPSFIEFVRFHFFEVLYDFSYSKALILPLWTMQFEFIGSYLLIFSLLLAHGRNKNPFILPVLIIAFSVLNLFYLAFFIGAAFARIYSKYGAKNFYCPGFFIFCVSVISAYFFYDFGSFFQLACSVSFFVSAMYWHPIRVFLSSRLSIYLGKISFPLYLIHSVAMWVIGLNLIGFLDNWLINIILILVSLFSAHLMSSVDIFGTLIARKVGSLIFDKYPSVYSR